MSNPWPSTTFGWGKHADNVGLVTAQFLSESGQRPRWYWVYDFDYEVYITPRAVFWPWWVLRRKLGLDWVVFGLCRRLKRAGFIRKAEGEPYCSHGTWHWPLQWPR